MGGLKILDGHVTYGFPFACFLISRCSRQKLRSVALCDMHIMPTEHLYGWGLRLSGFHLIVLAVIRERRAFKLSFLRRLWAALASRSSDADIHALLTGVVSVVAIFNSVFTGNRVQLFEIETAVFSTNLLI